MGSVTNGEQPLRTEPQQIPGEQKEPEHSSVIDVVEKSYHGDLAVTFVPNTVAKADPPVVNGFSVATPTKRGMPYQKAQLLFMPVESQKYWSFQLAGASAANFPPKQTTGFCVRSKATFTRPLQIPEYCATTISTSNLLRGAWALVLARYLDSTDVVFGSNVSEYLAPIPEKQDILGSSFLTLPLRVQINKDDTTTEFLGKLQQQISDMIPHAHTGLENIHRLGNEVSEVCNFQNQLIVQRNEKTHAAEERSIEPIRKDLGVCPLVVQCAIGNQESVEVEFIFDAGSISPQQIHTICDQFEYIVTQLMTQETCLLSDINLCGPQDMRQILQWNRRTLPRRVHACVQDLISEQALRDPDHEAIHACDGSVTYAELDKLSDHLAVHLASLGVHVEIMVAMCFEKSKWAVIAMLAILKAGGAFVSLDPAHPANRHRELLGRINAEIIITSPEVAPSCSGMVKHTVVLSADFISQLPKSKSDGNGSASLGVGGSPEGAAYVIFTSGSTGTPKGMVVEQAALCSSIIGHGEAYSLEPASRVLQFSNFTFDSCLSEILTPLVFGGTVCMPSDAQRLQDIAKFIRDAEVNMAILTPTFASTLKPEEIPTLRTLILSGEKISRAQLETWCDKVEFINAYGPSEVCVDCMLHVIRSSDDSPNKIGFAHNATCWIVDPDDHDRLAPIGCPGELVVQAPGLARGYLGDEEQTKASFLATAEWLPASVVGEGRPFRLYKTGDLVRYNHDGSMEYIGRKDTQVKLRGQRLELGEIEYNIRKVLPNLEHIVVELVGQASHNVLVGFLAFPRAHEGEGGQDLKDLLLPMDETMRNTLTRLVDDLEAALPLFMVPRLFLPLQDMPFTSSMKIDRKRLRIWASNMSAAQLASYSLVRQEKIVPTTEMEFKIRELWAEVLKIDAEAIGKNDNFLRIGGDSISAIGLVSRARRQGISLTIASIFNDGRLSHVAASAGLIDRASSALQEVPVAPFSLLPADRIDNMLRQAREQCQLSSDQIIEDVYPCTPLQEGLMTLTLQQPSSNIVRYVYRLNGQVDAARFKDAWSKTVLHCVNLRTRIVFVEGRMAQVVVRGDTCWNFDDHADSVLAIEDERGISMGYGSQLFRYALVQGNDGHLYFIWIMHYCILDPWTGDLMRQKLHSAYHDVVGPKLQPFNHFIKYIADLNHEECNAYWTAQLQGAQRTVFPQCNLEHKTKEGTARTGQFIRLPTNSVSWPPSPASSITRATVLRAAWALMLARYCKSEDVCFGTNISGRNAPTPGLDAMVGLMPATVPVRVRFDGGQTAIAWLQEIQAQATNMTAFEQYGLRNISELSREARAACDFTSLMIIQPAHLLDSAAASDSVMVSAADGLEGYFNYPLLKGYFTQPLFVQILVYEDHVGFDAVYDPCVMVESQIRELSDHFERALKQLCTLDETTLIGHMLLH
jgi:amino acid adenylation domain-containing protein